MNKFLPAALLLAVSFLTFSAAVGGVSRALSGITNPIAQAIGQK